MEGIGMNVSERRTGIRMLAILFTLLLTLVFCFSVPGLVNAAQPDEVAV